MNIYHCSLFVIVLPLEVWCQKMFLLVPGRGGIFAKAFSKSNLPNRSFARLDAGVSASTSSLGGRLCCTDFDTGIVICFFSETAVSGSQPCSNEEHDAWMLNFDLANRSGGTIIFRSGTSHKGVCPSSYPRQILIKLE